MTVKQCLPLNKPDIIISIESQIESLKQAEKKYKIECVGATIDEMKKELLKQKEKCVLEVHHNSITKTYIKKNGKSVLRWQTICGDKRPRCSTYEALIDKLYEFYFGKTVITDCSFNTIFNLALQEKIDTERPKEKTIRDYRSSYKAFITEELGAKDIRQITGTELKKFIQDTVDKLSLTEKRLLKLKGVLNLVFNYATDYEHRIIELSPVPQNNKQFKKNCRLVKSKPEEKAFQPDEIERIREYLWKRARESKYDYNAYAILFASETGLREGEIPSLKWADISKNTIHIHSQQNDEIRDGKKVYYYNPTTKDEKGYSRDGRYFPMNKKIKEILNEVKAKQEALGIHSEWVFANRKGEWITTASYYEALFKVSKLLGLSLSNNHAFRIALNSYVLIPMGIRVTERAKMLGHSVDTNIKHYTFARTDEFLCEITNKWNDYIDETRGSKEEVVPMGTSNIIQFKEKEKNPKTAIFKAL